MSDSTELFTFVKLKSSDLQLIKDALAAYTAGDEIRHAYLMGLIQARIDRLTVKEANL